MWVTRAGIPKILVRIAYREDTDQTASSEAVYSGFALFIWQATTCSVRNFRTSYDLLYTYNDPKVRKRAKIRN